MSQPQTLTVYIPSPSNPANFPISYVSLPAPQSQIYQLMQSTYQIQSTPDPATALGLGTLSTIRTTIVDQQGQNNAPSTHLLNLNNPQGTLAITVQHFNTTTIPMSANETPKTIFPPGQSTAILKGIINTSLCNGYYFGAVGTTQHTVHANRSPTQIIITYTLP